MLRGPSDYLSAGVNPNDLKQQYQFSTAGLYQPTMAVVPGNAPSGKGIDSFEPSSFLDTGIGAEDFFSPFLNPDFPIDINIPLQLGDGVMQAQAPLMQVAQNQSGVRRNPKLVGKRKLQAAAKARQAPVQPMQNIPSVSPAPQSKVPTPVAASPAPQSQLSAANASLAVRSSPTLSSSQPCYIDSPPSQGSLEQDYGDDEPDTKRQKRLVKNRQAAQLFRKRQKQYISDLENKVAEVTNKNIALMAKVDVLATENQMVKDQLKFLRTFVVSALEQAFPPQKYSEMQQQLGDIGLHDAAKKEPPTMVTLTTSSSSSSSSLSNDEK